MQGHHLGPVAGDLVSGRSGSRPLSHPVWWGWGQAQGAVVICFHRDCPPSYTPGHVLGLGATAGSLITKSLPPGVYSLVCCRGGRRDDKPK